MNHITGHDDKITWQSVEYFGLIDETLVTALLKTIAIADLRITDEYK